MKYILILLLTLFSAGVFAQQQYEDVIHLKDGRIIRGIIIEQVPNKSVKIKTNDRSILVFTMDEIEKLTKEETIGPTTSSKKSRTNTANKKERKYSGYSNITELNFGRAVYSDVEDIDPDADEEVDGFTPAPSIGLQTVNGYQFSPFISAGIGVGFQFQKLITLVPLFADVRIHFMDKRLSPFLSFSGGYAFTLGELWGVSDWGLRNEGGVMAASALGVRFYPNHKIALNLGLAFRYNELRIYQEEYSNGKEVERYTDESLTLVGIRFGFSF